MTVPPSRGGQDRAVLAAGHVHADHGHVGRPAQGAGDRRRPARPGRGRRPAPPGRPGRRRPAGRARPRSARPRPYAAPARRAAASDSEPDLPAPPMTATVLAPVRAPDGPPGRSAPARRRRRAPPGPARGSRSSGSTAAIERANRIAWPRAGTCSLRTVPAGQPVGDRQRGQRQRDQGGDPVARPAGRAASPARPRRPMPISMPPEPVTGFCILPRVRDDVQHLGAHRGAVAGVLGRTAAGSWPRRG